MFGHMTCRPVAIADRGRLTPRRLSALAHSDNEVLRECTAVYPYVMDTNLWLDYCYEHIMLRSFVAAFTLRSAASRCPPSSQELRDRAKSRAFPNT